MAVSQFRVMVEPTDTDDSASLGLRLGVLGMLVVTEKMYDTYYIMYFAP